MPYVTHPLVIPSTIEAREYQMNILNTALEKNTLCVLPTGLGKTSLAIMLAANRLGEYPQSKVLIMAPTRPLAEQHRKSFLACMDLKKNSILLLTGKIPPQNRKEYYNNGSVVAATPQTIENDIKTGVLDLSDFSLLVVDEVHRAVKKYAYPYVCRMYMTIAKHPRILGLTASPGSSSEKIKEICANLFVDAVEIRTENDKDVKPYVRGVETEVLRVELTGDLKKIRENLRSVLKERLRRLRGRGVHAYSKTDLLLAQSRISGLLKRDNNPAQFIEISLIAETLKVWHALELAETQSAGALDSYFKKIASDKSRAAARLLSDREVKNSILLLERMKREGIENPKILELKRVVYGTLSKNKNAKLIVFSHYRDNIDQLFKILSAIAGCRPAVLIGQSKGGLKQKEQIDLIKDYEADVFNCLITSSIGEEGLHLSSADVAVFYDSTSSEIRTIQRRGRVGRTKVGRLVIILVRGTRDEANYYSARRKERSMEDVLRGMKNMKKESF